MSALTASRPSNGAAFFTMMRTAWKVFVVRSMQASGRSKLMTFTLAGFMFAYLFAGYFLFSRGLHFIANIPVIGPLLSERIVFMMFFLFFVMLVFSNAIISYTMLFRSKETDWLLTLPVSHRVLYFWKFCETLAISSWALVFISAPLLGAFASLHGLSWDFFFQSAFVYLPFVIIPAALASWGLLFLVRIFNKWVAGAIAAAALFWVAQSAYGIYANHQELQQNAFSQTVAVHQVLEYTNMSKNPFVPSMWISESLVNWGNGFHARGWFYGLILISYSFMGLLMSFAVAGRSFYPVFSSARERTFRHSIARRRARTAKRRGRGIQHFGLKHFVPVPFTSRSTRSLIAKDVFVLVRDPAQWLQFVIIFGLLLLYTLNLGNMGYEDASPFWAAMIGHLNLTVCALALSTLTTRFVFPQFSLEGQRLAILSLAPFPLSKVVWQKFFMSWAFAGLLTTGLMLLSGIMIQQSWQKTLYFSSMIAILSGTLSAVAVGLGTLFPNLKESNPARIVSSFGGTLCLIVSFLYILAFIATLAWPVYAGKDNPEGAFLPSTEKTTLATAVAIGISATFAAIPLLFSLRRVEKVENLEKL